MTSSIERSALVWHSAARMYGIVNDVAAYPEFIPWCKAAEVHESDNAQVLASLEVVRAGMRYRFTTRNRLLDEREIRITLVDGPFSQLEGIWRFQPLAQEACKVVLRLEFALAGPVARMGLGTIFNQAANSLVEAFCQRADAMSGVT